MHHLMNGQDLEISTFNNSVKASEISSFNNSVKAFDISSHLYQYLGTFTMGIIDRYLEYLKS